MELNKFTDEELQAELQRRREERNKKRATDARCRNCKFFARGTDGYGFICKHRTFIARGIRHNYTVRPHSKCQEFEAK